MKPGPDHNNALVKVRCLECGRKRSNDTKVCKCGGRYAVYHQRIPGDDEPRPWHPGALHAVR